MTTNPELLDIRKSIDNLDNALVALLAERFRLTEHVGFIKRAADLPPEDLDRERAQELHYSELASTYGVDRATVVNVMRAIISEVKKRHAVIRATPLHEPSGSPRE